ncbi:Hypothetical protein LCAKO_0710 [Lacticaseibacillus paracasei subsp. paracasei]|uniref:Uncharacterized protein n=1 Tax=Lacticaseibacillus paracasei subsp. paracasei TaxID=47714 RepID=A0AAP9HFB2_LACPA|nr:Hypothetical protein LCAKO_0710 [Lacticaseibacillus paracasei subsp. paracasei]
MLSKIGSREKFISSFDFLSLCLLNDFWCISFLTAEVSTAHRQFIF